MKIITGHKVKTLFNKVINSIFGDYTYEKFVIITRSRTGSNLLMSLMNSHKDIEASGEKFSRLEGKDCLSIWKVIFSKKIRKKWVGFKIFYYHPLDSGDKKIWELLKNDSKIRVVHLRRENLLRVHISRLIAGKNDIWATSHNPRNPVNSKKIHIDIEELLADIEETRKWEEKTRVEFVGHSIIEVKYEELTSDINNEMWKVFKFLELKNCKVKSRLKRQNPESIEDLVSNYTELCDSLKTTKYYSMLNEA